ncbi:MAG: UvrD-helicase domain-containing protein, partial [Alphaproteobacteria bacterium]
MIDVNAEQRRASNPLSSVWVSASAGSGKTKVLTDRVLNLLLMTGRPEKIICLTFTKTAAAEMANRISNVLKKWVIMDGADLAAEIERLTGMPADAQILEQARRLFALTLETPGGMKIMTIHGFSQSVLKRFPLEAGVSPHFEILDETASKDMLDTLTHEALKNPALKKDVSVLASFLNENELSDLLKSVLGYRLKLLNLCRHSHLESVILNLKKKMNIFGYQSENQIICENFNPNDWERLKTTCLTKKDEILSKKKNDAEALCVLETLERIKHFRIVNATEALLRTAFYIIELYEREKQIKSLLDYDDLIEYTRRLLNEGDKAAWVLYKLDGGIDHILVDEAQDTNPHQWSIIRKLAEEFFAGEGASDTIRTIFAVGDKKQSIFSFQNADPEEFDRMRLFFEERVKQAGQDFDLVPFNFSFRSTRAVLEFVNHLLRYPPARVGVLLPNEDGTHLAFRECDAGLVEIWPLEKSEKSNENAPWKPPVERIASLSPVTKLAQKVALKIKHMIETQDILESAGRPVNAGDFLILVQRRNAFVSELVRFLKEYRIPVAGIDRLILTNYIAVQDLLAMAKFALLPEDDLNLAALLKSPLIRLTEDELFTVCYDRGQESLWQRVQCLFPEQAAFLGNIMNQADKMPPFEFFSYILSVSEGRKHFEARLGSEVNEALDEFLNLTLAYEKTGILSLQAFLKWIRDKEVEIKRDLDQSSLNAVRIMTVHGAKGLQGNIVFLPDTRFIPG